MNYPAPLTEDQRSKAYIKTDLAPEDEYAWYVKYRGVVRNAKYRGLECSLTFAQYLSLLKKAGLTEPNQIGMRIEQYNLSRHGDTGGYVKGNCRFITSKQNRAERVINGCFDDRAEKMRGRTKFNDPSVALMADKKRGRTKETHPYIALAAEKNSKSFVLRDPEGRVYRGKGIAAFCHKHGLSVGSLGLLMTKGCKGWSGRYV